MRGVPGRASTPVPGTSGSTGAHGAALDRPLALALLLPALAFAAPWPRALLAGDPEAALTGAGWASLFALAPALLLLVGRRAGAPTGLWLLGGVLAWGALSLALAPARDTLERDRAVALALASAAAFLGGAALGEAGRAVLARGLVLASLLASLGALAGGAPFAGALQNSGATSELALPGALAGAWLFAADRASARPWRWLGAAALAAQSAYAARAPVIAAVVALTAVLALGLVRLERGARRRLAALAGLALAAGAVGFAARPAALPPEASEASRAAPARTPPGSPEAGLAEAQAADAAEDSPAPGDLAGFEVRWRVWRSLPRLVADHPWLGVGPGQFPAAYPPYRDPDELRLSETGMGGAASDVEHAHADWLQGFADLGLPGGALWAAFLGLAGWRALAALSSGRAEAALAAAALGVLANSLLRAPLSANPAAAPVGLALFGALLATPGRAGLRADVPAWVAALVLALHVDEARAIVAHGRALAALVAEPAEAPLLAALAARPDSVPALSIAARSARGDARAVAQAWEAVLARRPHNREALAQLAKARAEAGDLAAARSAWSAALELAPGDPALLSNLARAAAMAGEVDAALELHRRAGFEPDRLVQLACAVLQENADLDVARSLLDHAEPRYRGLSTERTLELARELEAQGLTERARVLKGMAHLSFARQHAAEGDPESAVRSYRQAAAGLSRPGAEGARLPPALSYELAAALALAGRLEEAQAALPESPHDAGVMSSLPHWAGEALLRLLAAPAAQGGM
jgi:O-antigen ligase